ncbi:MAG: phospholipid carrier-dependent glycosyltransferase, partial [Actinobacteria bacterium]|nr:phospholipid carrier-dependent glycosyltransferase [Actinomycetota bacterium]
MPTSRAARVSALRARLVPPMPGSEFWGWAGPLLVTALGAFLRFNRLSMPGAVIFDETYYVPDAFGILRYGVEHNYISSRNALIAHGNPHIFTAGGEFVVHPPLGKLMIAVGEWLFGLTPFGWRFAVAVVGSLSILVLARVARRMTRSTLLGCVAGFLMALDGLELVMSRTALLDIFVMFWVLAAFGCLVVDRDHSRLRLAEAVAARPAAEGGPRLGIRWWRVGAGVCLGLACASKWNGVYFIPVFAAMCLAWDIGARRAAGVSSPATGALARDAAWLPVSLAVVPFAVYLASWTGWMVTGTGYDRTWAAQHGIHTPVISELVSLYQYQLAILKFNLQLRAH